MKEFKPKLSPWGYARLFTVKGGDPLEEIGACWFNGVTGEMHKGFFRGLIKIIYANTRRMFGGDEKTRRE